MTGKAHNGVKLDHFKRSEFQGWYWSVDPDVLLWVDKLRNLWMRPIIISPANGAVGRKAGPVLMSRHNVDYWGKVMALDVMPAGMNTPNDVLQFKSFALEVGFKGIGYYPLWKPSHGFHLDKRENSAQWGRLGITEYVSFTEAFNYFKRAWLKNSDPKNVVNVKRNKKY